MFKVRAKRMTIELNSAFIASKVVNAPGPAKSGKITGIIVAEPLGLSILNISHPKVISQAITKITNEPATAKDETSTLKRCKIPSPAKKKPTSIKKEKDEALNGLKVRFLFLKSIKIGIEPVTSIIANNTINALTKSFKLKPSIINRISLNKAHRSEL